MPSKVWDMTAAASYRRCWGVGKACASGVIALVISWGIAGPAFAGGAHSLFIIDANTGATLADQESTEPRYPASLTKMMTLYLTFEALEQGRLKMTTKIPISQAAANAAPSKLDLAPGDEITLDDAILALVTKSANDVAIAIAEKLGGTEANFAKLMTAKAHSLGMKATTFRNASGLPDPGQTTTARDMTTLGLRLYDDHPRYFPLFATRTHSYNGATFRNHNTLMLQMPGINGIKTGYTHASGFNLVSSLQVDGKHLIGAIFGGETAGSRNAHMKVALTRALAKASTTKTRRPTLLARIAAAVLPAKKPKPAPAPVAATGPASAEPLASKAPEALIATPVASEQAVQAPASGIKFALARVRPLTVAPPVVPRAVAANPVAPVETIQPAPTTASSRVARPAQPSTVAPIEPPASPTKTALAKPSELVARLPSSFETQMATFASNIATAPAPAAAPLPATAAIEPARTPSTLSTQLAQLTAPPAPAPMAKPPFALAGPSGPPPVLVARTGPRFVIQVGAFATPAEADKQLATVQAQFPQLAAYGRTRQAVAVGDKTVYRARLTGFDQASAASSCGLLNNHATPCLALKSE